SRLPTSSPTRCPRLRWRPLKPESANSTHHPGRWVTAFSRATGTRSPALTACRTREAGQLGSIAFWVPSEADKQVLVLSRWSPPSQSALRISSTALLIIIANYERFEDLLLGQKWTTVT